MNMILIIAYSCLFKKGDLTPNTTGLLHSCNTLTMLDYSYNLNSFSTNLLVYSENYRGIYFFYQRRLFSGSPCRGGNKHSWDLVDRLDTFMDTITPDNLKSFDLNKHAHKGVKVKSKVLGLHNYVFSNKMALTIEPCDFYNHQDLVLKLSVDFLSSLKDNTVYKCLFVGVTDDGGVKSSSEGGFFVTRYTRPEYILMKVKSGVEQFAGRYHGVHFDHHSLAYKEWLLASDVGNKMGELVKALDRVSHADISKNAPDRVDLTRDSDTPRLKVENYNRWLNIVGSIALYNIPDSSKYAVSITENIESGVKIDVESIENAEFVSWIDKWVDQANKLWVRCFKGGVQLFYKDSEYLHYEIPFKTEVWAEGLKEYEYNAKFGSLDIETYKTVGAHGDGLQIPYAAGFTDYKGEPTVFYIQDGDKPFGVVVRTLQALLCSKYTGGTFYVHNLARFDSRLILEALGMMVGVDCSLMGRDMNNLFHIGISKKVRSKRYNITLMDSYYMLPFKLDALGEKFNTDVKKTHFPYDFVNKDTLFYKGEIPPYTYYNGNVSVLEYRELYKKSWDLKDETLIYLKNDLKCLHHVMHMFNKTIFKDFLVNGVNVASYSALSKLVYTTNYYPYVQGKIPVISGYLEDWVRNAYKGGVVDVIKHLIFNAVKYDSNSHYPSAMLNDMPVGIPRFTDQKDLSKIYGFCYVEVTAPTEDVLTCAILPTKDENGDLHCPRGRWKDTYYSEELKNAVEYGYTVKIISALVFDRGVGLFDAFIKEMFNRKAAAKERGDFVGELLNKLIQNSLYGKSGQKEIIHRFKLVNNQDVKQFEREHMTDLSHVFGNKTVIRYQGKISGELEGVITKLFEDKHIENKNDHEDDMNDLPLPARKMGSVKSSVAIAAAITANARIAMSKYKNIDGNKYLGGDTDSAIMEKELDDHLIGKGLGMMKEECRIKVGLFADKKLYLTIDDKDVTVIKSRGVGRSLESGLDILNIDDFIELFRGETLTKPKTKFLIQSDGIYIKPQSIKVKISPTRVVKIRDEVSVILTDTNHPLYDIALKISVLNHALILYNPVSLAVTTVTRKHPPLGDGVVFK